MTRALMVFLVACSQRGPKDAREFATRFADAYTLRFSECLHAPIDVSAEFLLPDDYVERVANAAERERVKYDKEAAADCLDQMAAVACEGINELRFLKDQACAEAIVGQQAVGAACFEVELDECAPGAFCDATLDCNGTCRKLGALGSTCSSTQLCDFGSQCIRGLCRALSAVGQPCGGGEGVVCDTGLWCDATTTAAGSCRARQESGTCVLGGLNECAAGFQCAAIDDETFAGQCEVSRAEGEGCIVGRVQCAPFLSCKRNAPGDANGTCTRWGEVGAPCRIVEGEGESFGCINSQCPAGVPVATCAPLLVAGDRCTEAAECESGICDGVYCVAACPIL